MKIKGLFIEYYAFICKNKRTARFNINSNNFVCLCFFVPLENSSLIWNRHHTGERLQILTFARHSWPLGTECSLACHTNCDTGLPFIMVISEDPWHSLLLPSIWQWDWPYLLLRLRSVAAEIRTPNFPLYYERKETMVSSQRFSGLIYLFEYMLWDLFYYAMLLCYLRIVPYTMYLSGTLKMS